MLQCCTSISRLFVVTVPNRVKRKTCLVFNLDKKLVVNSKIINGSSLHSFWCRNDGRLMDKNHTEFVPDLVGCVKPQSNRTTITTTTITSSTSTKTSTTTIGKSF